MLDRTLVARRFRSYLSKTVTARTLRHQHIEQHHADERNCHTEITQCLSRLNATAGARDEWRVDTHRSAEEVASAKAFQRHGDETRSEQDDEREQRLVGQRTVVGGRRG